MMKFKLFIAIVITVLTLSHSKQSQAAIGALTGAGIVTAGLVLAGAGAGGGIIGTYLVLKDCYDSECLSAIVPVTIGAVILGLGLIVLDGEQKLEFRELKRAEAAKLGISSSELSVYNSEIDQANMIMSEVATELSKIEKPTPENSAAAWNGVKNFVSPETFSTMQKIVSQK